MGKIANPKNKTGNKLGLNKEWKEIVPQTDKAALDIKTYNNKARRARLHKVEYQGERELQRYKLVTAFLDVNQRDWKISSPEDWNKLHMKLYVQQQGCLSNLLQYMELSVIRNLQMQ